MYCCLESELQTFIIYYKVTLKYVFKITKIGLLPYRNIAELQGQQAVQILLKIILR